MKNIKLQKLNILKTCQLFSKLDSMANSTLVSNKPAVLKTSEYSQNSVHGGISRIKTKSNEVAVFNP